MARFQTFDIANRKLFVKARLVDFVQSHCIRDPGSSRTPFVLAQEENQLVEQFPLVAAWSEQWDAFHGRCIDAIRSCTRYDTEAAAETTMCRLFSRDWVASPYYDGPPLIDLQKAISELREYTRYNRDMHKKYQILGDGIRLRMWDTMHRPASVKRMYSGEANFSGTLPALWNELSGTSIVMTRGGCVASVPEQAKDGDIIAVVNGCKTPLLIRRREPDGYILICDCYVHGTMYGEITDLGFEETEIALV